MRIYEQKDRFLTAQEWKALQAAMPYNGGLYMLPRLWEAMNSNTEGYELFTLRSSPTRGIVEQGFFLLIGFQLEGGEVPNPCPKVFAIYTDDSFIGCPPSLEELCKKKIPKIATMVAA